MIRIDPDVRGHRDHHLPVVLGLRLVARLEGQVGQLGNAVDQAGDLLAELRLDVLDRRRCVLDRVVQERGAQRLGVEPHPGADLGDADRMRDELLAGEPALVGVVLAGVDEGVLDALAIDRDSGLVGVLLDDREQVRQQSLFGIGQRRSPGPLGLVGPESLVGLDRGRGAPDDARGGRAARLHTVCLGFALLRNRWPSS